MARKSLKVSRCAAKQMLAATGVDFNDDFHALRSDAVNRIEAAAKASGYRKPKSASGSTGRMFFQSLARLKGCSR